MITKGTFICVNYLIHHLIFSVDFIVSNDVLEWELKRTKDEIELLKLKDKKYQKTWKRKNKLSSSKSTFFKHKLKLVNYHRRHTLGS